MGSGQTWDPVTYARNARFVSDLGAPVLELLAPRAGERILDLGCGDGVLTKKLVELGCQVVGVDASPTMIAAAQERGVKPGGGFVGECGGYGNKATIVQALERALRRRGINAQAVNPWHFPTAEGYRNILEAQGFIVNTLA